MNEQYIVTRIDEPDFGCEGRSDNQQVMSKVWMKPVDDLSVDVTDRIILIPDAYLYEYSIEEGTKVIYRDNGLLLKVVDVVAAVIRKDNKIFTTQRGYGQFKGGWEFPGGKIENNETPKQALIREIKEELDTEIEVGEQIDTIEYDYDTFHLSMKCFWCKVIRGNLELKEHQAARWLMEKELDEVEWLPADITLIDKIRKNMI